MESSEGKFLSNFASCDGKALRSLHESKHLDLVCNCRAAYAGLSTASTTLLTHLMIPRLARMTVNLGMTIHEPPKSTVIESESG
jgi:hypothetical protein